MEDATIPEFVIEVTLNNQEKKQLTVKPEETSDGELFYTCKLENNMLSQIRRDENKHWKQVWGELDEAYIKKIGEAIDQQNTKT